MPIRNMENEIIAVIQFTNKKNFPLETNHYSGFSENDIKVGLV